MFLAIRNGKIAEWSDNEESLLKLDRATHEVVEWNHPLPHYDVLVGGTLLDPRSEGRKLSDARERYRQRRRRAYPSVREQLDMMYWDAVDGTTTWVDEITRIKEEYPKPTE